MSGDEAVQPGAKEPQDGEAPHREPPRPSPPPPQPPAPDQEPPGQDDRHSSLASGEPPDPRSVRIDYGVASAAPRVAVHTPKVGFIFTAVAEIRTAMVEHAKDEKARGGWIAPTGIVLTLALALQAGSSPTRPRRRRGLGPVYRGRLLLDRVPLAR
jgi:hypothetical protein